MSATHRDVNFSVVVEDYERLPAWVLALSEQTEQSCDDIVVAMIDAEMRTAGEKFLKRFPELFRAGTELV